MDPVQSLWAARSVEGPDGAVSVDVVGLVWPDGVVRFDVYAGSGDGRVCLTGESFDAEPDEVILAALVAAR